MTIMEHIGHIAEKVEMDDEDMECEAQLIVSGRPIDIKGLVEVRGELMVLMAWTTGDCYVPYDLAKEYFQDLMFEYLTRSPVYF